MTARLSKKNYVFSFDTLAYYLIPVSLVYLTIPYIIFFAGWLKGYWAVFTILLIIIPLGYIILQPRKAPQADTPDSSGVTLSHLLLLITLIFLIMTISGAGGVGYQDSDWKKHNALMKDLQQRDWPVVYSQDGVPLPLVYYIAYYMPAALVGKAGGNIAAQNTLFIWTFIGLFIAALWFIILVRKKPYLSIALFILFSGLDIVGVGVRYLMLGPLEDPLEYGSHIEFWADNWQYSSHLTMVFWVPQHALSGWIISGILIYSILYRPKREEYLYYASLAPMWSPFIAVGILPFLAVDFFTASGSITKRIRNYIALPNIFGIAIVVITGVYFISKFFPVPLSLKQSELGLIFTIPRSEGVPWQTILALMFWFIILEFGIYTIIIIFYTPLTNSNVKSLFISSIIFLTLLPLFRYGSNNDLVMRATIPAMFLLAVLFTQAAARKDLSLLTRGILLGVILIGAVTPVMEVTRHLTETADLKPIRTSTMEKTRDIISLGSHYNTRSKLIQYIGSLNSPFFNLMVNGTNCQIPPGASIQPNSLEMVDHRLSDRITLVCFDKQLAGNYLVVHMFLQTRPPLNGGEETHDTIYVQLIDENGDRVAGSDILLHKNYKDKTINTHKIELPPNLKPGDYHLTIGIYYFEDGQPVNVGSATIDTPITIN